MAQVGNQLAQAHTPREADCSSPARRYSGALLLLAIASLLVACGSGGGGSSADGGSSGGCIVGVTATQLTWDAVNGATGYRVYGGTATGTYIQPVDVGSMTTTPVPDLLPATTYYFAVTAYDGSNNESAFSNEVCKTIS